jgi:hypothetical protein
MRLAIACLIVAASAGFATTAQSRHSDNDIERGLNTHRSAEIRTLTRLG